MTTIRNQVLNISVIYFFFISFILQEAISLLEPMTNDPINYVRQGALIASALVLSQQNENTCPKVCFNQIISQSHLDDVHEK